MRKTLLLFAILALVGCTVEAPADKQDLADQKRANPNHRNQNQPGGQNLAPQHFSDWVVRSAVFSPDGNKVLVGYHRQVGPFTAQLEYTDVVTGKLLWSQPADGDLAPMAILPDGEHALLCSNSSVQLWSSAEGRYVKDIIPHGGYPQVFALTPSGKVCAVPTGQGLTVFEVPSGKRLGTVKPSAGPVAVALSPDGRRVLCAMNPTVGVPNTVEFWDVSNARLLKSYPKWTGSEPVAISPDGKYAACGFVGRSRDGKGSEKQRLAVWETQSGKEVARLDSDGFLAFLPGSKILIIVDQLHRTVQRVEWATGRIVKTIEYPGEHDFKAVTPDGRWILFDDRRFQVRVLRVWDLGTGQLVRTVEGPNPGAR
jgi:WD40 repeat protein